MTRIKDFFGHHATVAKRPPGRMSERRSREFVTRRRSEDAHGRKNILSVEGS